MYINTLAAIRMLPKPKDVCCALIPTPKSLQYSTVQPKYYEFISDGNTTET